MNEFKIAKAGIKVLILSVFALSAQATNLVTNGDFESTTAGVGQLGYNTNASGWTTNGYNFLFASGTADTTGVNGQYGNLKLWGPNDGSANGLTSSSPSGGNFIGADGDFHVDAITQTINNLIAGNSYTLDFSWAGAQQSPYNGASTEQWKVSLGGQTLSTSVVNLASHGFSGWMHESFTYIASSSTEVLSFLAVGGPSGLPPFVLLDGVSLNATAVPEPETLTLLGIGLLGCLGFFKQQKKRQA